MHINSSFSFLRTFGTQFENIQVDEQDFSIYTNINKSRLIDNRDVFRERLTAINSKLYRQPYFFFQVTDKKRPPGLEVSFCPSIHIMFLFLREDDFPDMSSSTSIFNNIGKREI